MLRRLPAILAGLSLLASLLAVPLLVHSYQRLDGLMFERSEVTGERPCSSSAARTRCGGA